MKTTWTVDGYSQEVRFVGLTPEGAAMILLKDNRLEIVDTNQLEIVSTINDLVRVIGLSAVVNQQTMFMEAENKTWEHNGEQPAYVGWITPEAEELLRLIQEN
ncbi:MAG: hypothetical protein M0R80_13405 [Proteobacteria bacterium]|jgi:hypothetical protein|nr:hypothetical protein [Pseudomonadota bacterium]